MEPDREALEAAIAALESRRAMLGDAVVEPALASLREKLAARISAGSRELKQVTLLFVDVVGSTSMEQRLDPESADAVMNPALERFTTSVGARDGRVVKYTGDGLLAVFGGGVSREDDAESAILAGLEIIEDARRWAPEARRMHGVADFNVRVGIHTGTALLGEVGDRRDITGAAVNLAARMEQAAPPGRLRISHDTFRLVRGLFDVEEQPPLQVKGVDQPLRTWLVQRVRASIDRRVERGVAGVATPLVGRDAELAVLRATLNAVASSRRSRLATIVADAGIGKTRLLDEFRRSCDPERTEVVLARAHPRSTMHSLGVLRDLVTARLGLDRAMPVDAARERLESMLAPLSSAGDADVVPLIGHWLGLGYDDDPAVMSIAGHDDLVRERLFDAIVRWWRRSAEDRTLVVALDDAHWADDGSLDFLESLVAATPDRPLLVVALSRPALFERRAAWGGARDAYLQLDLAPLDGLDARALAASLLQRFAEAPAELSALIVRVAEGNPFAMEAVVNLLIDDGVIVERPDGWRVDREKLVVTRVPPSLAGVLQARLDALPAEERAAVHHAAVVGHVFWDVALSAIDPEACAALSALERKRFVVRRASSSVDAAVEYVFQHNLLHQSAYETMLREPKTRAHGRVGAFWSERADIDDISEVSPARTRALAEAHFHRSIADAPGWIDWFERRFEPYYHAFATNALRPLAEDVVAMSERIHGPRDPRTARMLVNLARLMMQSQQGDASPLLQRALEIQRHAFPGDHVDTARTLAVLGGWHAARGGHASAESYFRQALGIRERLLGPDAPDTLSLLDNLAKSVLELGRLDDAEAMFRRALDAHLTIDGPEHPETAFAMVALAEVLTKRGDVSASEAMVRRALAIQQRTLPSGHPECGLTSWHLAESLRLQGRLDEARAAAQQALETWELHFGGDHEWIAWACISLADIALARGSMDDAVAHVGQAAATLARLHAPDPSADAAVSVLRQRIEALRTVAEQRGAVES